LEVDTIVHLDLPFNPALAEREIGARWAGRKGPVQVFLLVTQDSIEEKLSRFLPSRRPLAPSDHELDFEAIDAAYPQEAENLKRKLEILLCRRHGPVADRGPESQEKLEERREAIAKGWEKLKKSVNEIFNALSPEIDRDERHIEAKTSERQAVFNGLLATFAEKDEQGRLRLAIPLSGPEFTDKILKLRDLLFRLPPE
jgi:hypothetical protein